MNETIINILKDIKPNVDYENCTTLIDDHYLDSLSILSLIAELEEEFDITIPAVDIIPDNFNSVENLSIMIHRLGEDN